MIKQTACLLILLSRVLSAAEEQWAVSARGMDVPFSSWQAAGAGSGTGVLVLVPAAVPVPSPPHPPQQTRSLPPTNSRQPADDHSDITQSRKGREGTQSLHQLEMLASKPAIHPAR
jgi:hypothetical protein